MVVNKVQLHCLQSLPLLSKVFLVLSVVDTALVIAFAVWQMTEVGQCMLEWESCMTFSSHD